MAKIRVNGSWLLEKNKIKDGMTNKFHKLLTEKDEKEILLRWVDFWRLGSHNSACLELPFSSEEVEAALLDLSKEIAQVPTVL